MGDINIDYEQRLSSNNILLLDIDDCILPSNINYFGITNDALEILEINLKRLVIIVEKYNMEVVIISAWSPYFTLDTFGKLIYNPRTFSSVNISERAYNHLEKIAGGLIAKYLNGYVKTLSSGNKHRDIKNAISIQDSKIIILEDTDFTEYNGDNCLWVNTQGFISGNIGYQIAKFITPLIFL